jgi:CRP-like cAMP-binding protein
VARWRGALMPRSTNPSHADIRIRAARGWPREHGEEAPDLALTASDKAELGRVAQIIDFRTVGSEIFSQGDDASFVYLLADGVVRIYHTLRNGERQILAFHWPGDLFGLAEHGKYVNSAEIIASSRVYRFPVRKLERFLLKNPNVQDAFLVKAVHDLRNTQRQVIVMGRFSIPRRLAVFLVDCSAHERYFDQSNQILTVPMSRYDIADYLGTSAETVTRALARLESQGMIHRVTPRDLKLELVQLKTFIDFD